VLDTDRLESGSTARPEASPELDAPTVDSTSRPTDAATEVDGAPSVPCREEDPFVGAHAVPGLSTVGAHHASLTDDEQAVFFGTQTSPSLWTIVSASRSTSAADFVLDPGSAITGDARDPSVSRDGRTLTFLSDRDDPVAFDVFMATRDAATGPFVNPRNLGLTKPGHLGMPHHWAPGDELYFTVALGPAFDVPQVYVDIGRSTGDGSHVEIPITALTDGDSSHPHVSVDGKRLYFASRRPGGAGLNDLWVSTRPDMLSMFGKPVLVAGPNSGEDEKSPWLSRDACRLYFLRSNILWVAERRKP
jgi:hypothetical protein